MKDPLHKKETPHEMLGVQVNCDKKQIETAFKKAIISGHNVKELTQARNTLNRPVERLFLDIFLYNETFINQLDTPIWGDSTALLNNRMEIAQHWSNIQKKLFPHFASTHSLALLWYWWVFYCEEAHLAELAKTPFEAKVPITHPSSLGISWAKTISNWVFIINSKEFWEEYTESKKNANISYFNPDDIKILCERLESHFINLFQHLSEKHRNNGDITSEKRYQEYELLFSAEKMSAKRQIKVGLQLPRKGKNISVCCGRKMLEDVGALNLILRQLEQMMRVRKSNELRDLYISLSDFGNIAELIEKKKFDEMIKAIEILPLPQQKEKIVLYLLAKAYLEKGNQHFGLNQFEDGLNCWKKGLETAELVEEIKQVIVSNGLNCWEKGLETGELVEEIKQVIVSKCKTKAASIQKNDFDTAIKILEKGIEIIPDNKLKKDLSVIYAQRGIDCVNKAIEQFKKDSSYDVKSEIRKGIEDLEKAVLLDLSNKHAIDELVKVESILANIDLTPIIKYMEAKQWEKAVNALEIILNHEPQNAKAKELHFICCVKWAPEEVNKIQTPDILNVGPAALLREHSTFNSSINFDNGTVSPVMKEADRRQNLNKAKRIIERGLKYNPNNKVLIEHINHINKAVAGISNKEGVQLTNRAGELLKRGNIKEAMDLFYQSQKKFEEAIRLDPTNSTLNNKLLSVKNTIQSIDALKPKPVYKTPIKPKPVYKAPIKPKPVYKAPIRPSGHRKETSPSWWEDSSRQNVFSRHRKETSPSWWEDSSWQNVFLALIIIFIIILISLLFNN